MLRDGHDGALPYRRSTGLSAARGGTDLAAQTSSAVAGGELLRGERQCQ